MDNIDSKIKTTKGETLIPENSLVLCFRLNFQNYGSRIDFVNKTEKELITETKTMMYLGLRDLLAHKRGLYNSEDRIEEKDQKEFDELLAMIVKEIEQ